MVPKPERHFEPAQFPNRFWKAVDYLLQHPDEILESLRRDENLWRLSRIFFLITLVMAAFYGAVMGGTNLLQDSILTFNAKMLMILVTAIKVPVLFLLTLVIVLPPIYVFQRADWGQAVFPTNPHVASRLLDNYGDDVGESCVGFLFLRPDQSRV